MRLLRRSARWPVESRPSSLPCAEQRLYDHLPTNLHALVPLALDLRWAWHQETKALFEGIDARAWTASGRNPVALLLDLSSERLRELAADSALRMAISAVASERKRAHAARPQVRLGGTVVYFSAEFAVTECLRIYSGGLGVLAGDHLKSASDLGLPLVGVGLFYGDGYFEQQLSPDGRQTETYLIADPMRLPLQRQNVEVSVQVGDRTVHVAVWRAEVGRVPLLLLDTDLPENTSADRRITDRLYGGDVRHRLEQEIVLGIGGMQALDALGIQPNAIHLNEGHAAFAAVELLRRAMNRGVPFDEAIARVQRHTVFTTHTPVPAGHDYFSQDLVQAALDRYFLSFPGGVQTAIALGRLGRIDPDNPADALCMTALALRLAGQRNGVSALHGEVSRHMWRSLWPGVAEEDVPIGHVTNGIHLPSWVDPRMAEVYERYIGSGWDQDRDNRRWGDPPIPSAPLWDARQACRKELIAEARLRLAAQETAAGRPSDWAAGALDPGRLTIVFARRFATYKRAALLFEQPARLEALLRTGNVQFVFAGKAHPKDEPGKEVLRRIAAFAAQPEWRDRFVFLEGYDPALARTLVAGADVWLNVPVRPYEASGTSGMKAAANGVANLSILDGWWAEAWRDFGECRRIGWAVVGECVGDAADAEALYKVLDQDVLPAWMDRGEDGLPRKWLEYVDGAIRSLAPVYNTNRMVAEYAIRFYRGAVARRHRTLLKA